MAEHSGWFSDAVWEEIEENYGEFWWRATVRKCACVWVVLIDFCSALCDVNVIPCLPIKSLLDVCFKK